MIWLVAFVKKKGGFDYNYRDSAQNHYFIVILRLFCSCVGYPSTHR